MVLQSGWYNEWAKGFDEYRQKKGEPALKPEDFGWPLAGETVVVR
jgi:hypothetical protein